MKKFLFLTLMTFTLTAFANEPITTEPIDAPQTEDMVQHEELQPESKWVTIYYCYMVDWGVPCTNQVSSPNKKCSEHNSLTCPICDSAGPGVPPMHDCGNDPL